MRSFSNFDKIFKKGGAHMFDNLKKDFEKGMPVITYIKKNFGFDSVDEFENYIRDLKEKAAKYDQLVKEGKQHN